MECPSIFHSCDTETEGTAGSVTLSCCLSAGRICHKMPHSITPVSLLYDFVLDSNTQAHAQPTGGHRAAIIEPYAPLTARAEKPSVGIESCRGAIAQDPLLGWQHETAQMTAHLKPATSQQQQQLLALSSQLCVVLLLQGHPALHEYCLYRCCCQYQAELPGGPFVCCTAL